MKPPPHPEHGYTIHGLTTITKEIYTICRKLGFVLFTFYLSSCIRANQAASEKTPVTNESVAFSLSVNYSFNNPFSYTKIW